MKTYSSLYTAILALSAIIMWPADAVAQKIKILSISHGTEAGSIKAEILDAGEKKIQSIVTRTFHMPTGASTTSTSYKILGGRYVVANLDYHAGNDYFYRLEATFDDGTEVKTDMYNSEYTEGAVWLSDLPVTNGTNVGVDRLPDGRALQIHPNSTYEKGLSTLSVSEFSINTSLKNEHNAKFTYAKFQFGLQAYAADGSNSNANCRLIVKMNGSETSSRANMKSYSNPTRGSAAYFFDQTQTKNEGINSVGFRVQGVGAATADDYGVLGAFRLYYTVPASNKQPQSVVFDNTGGFIYENNPEVRIGAYATGNTPIFYSIIQGEDIATLDENNVLRPKPNKSGVIVVEALTIGDDSYAPASATVTYKFNFGPTVEYVYSHKDVNDNKNQTAYLHVDPRDRQLEKLQMDIYDNVRTFKKIKTVDLLAEGLQNFATRQKNLYAIPYVNQTGLTLVHRITYKFSGEEEVVMPLCDGHEPFMYMSDIPGLVCRSGWGSCSIDGPYGSNTAFSTSKYSYGKGIGLHAVGTVETPTSFSLAPFYRFATDVGGQPVNNTRSARLAFTLHNGSNTASLNTGNVAWQNVYEWDFNLQNTGAGKTVKITVGNGGDGNTNDVATIGAPRFYYTTDTHHLPQTIEWKQEQQINDYKAFTIPLDATASSGLPVFYRVIAGAEHATIVDGDKLSVAVMPDEATIVVEAFQPGDKDYSHSDVTTCTFRLRRSVIVDKDSRIELLGGYDIDELIIYGDAKSCGQVSVKDGIANIKNLKLKFTFIPGEWTHIAFPSDLKLDKISNLTEKGFSYSTDEGTPGTFLLREYSPQISAESPYDSPWVAPGSADVQALKGYIMKLESDDKTPVEITFSMDNVSVDFENKMHNVYLSVNMRNCEPETRHSVYIRPANVKGNTLRVDMRYIPSDPSMLPLNHKKALEAMRVTHTPIRGAIRLTLPDQTPAKVAIFDKKGKHLVKAVNYISPMKIDVSDIKPGTYRMVVLYGPASREMLVEL